MELAFQPCDACGSRSYVFAQVGFGDSTVSYCGHHASKYWENLNTQVRKIVDMRHLIPTGRAQEGSMVG